MAVWYCKVHNVRFVEFLSGFIFEILYMEFSTYIVFLYSTWNCNWISNRSLTFPIFSFKLHVKNLKLEPDINSQKLKLCSVQWCHWAQKKGRSDYFAAFFAQWNVTLPLAHTSMYLLTTQTRLLLKVVSVMRFWVYGSWFMTSIGTVELIRAGIPCCHSPFGSFASKDWFFCC